MPCPNTRLWNKWGQYHFVTDRSSDIATIECSTPSMFFPGWRFGARGVHCRNTQNSPLLRNRDSLCSRLDVEVMNILLYTHLNIFNIMYVHTAKYPSKLVKWTPGGYSNPSIRTQEWDCLACSRMNGKIYLFARTTYVRSVQYVRSGVNARLGAHKQLPDRSLVGDMPQKNSYCEDKFVTRIFSPKA